MGSLSWDGQNIEDLPAEMLQMSVSRFPRTVLEEVAGRLHGIDAIGSGNWAVVAEKLGYCDNSQLERIARQALVARTFPGLLLLQEWSRDPGSTAYVLLNVLREAGREDVLHMVVEALYNVHYMLLSVMVDDQVTREKRFLRVRTKKTSTLAASLENELPGLSCYIIVGPRTGISFQTIAEELQGKQLTLRKFPGPQSDSVEQIYGTPPNSSCTTLPTRNVQPMAATTTPSPTTTTACYAVSSCTPATTSQMTFNILPTQHHYHLPQPGPRLPAITVTIPKAPFSNPTQLDMNIPPGVQWVNNLSSPRDSPIQENEAIVHHTFSPRSPPLCEPNIGVANNLQGAFAADEREIGKKIKIDSPDHANRSFCHSPLTSLSDVNFPDLSMISTDGNDVCSEQAPVPCHLQQPLHPFDLMAPKELNRSHSLEALTPVKQLYETAQDEHAIFTDNMRQPYIMPQTPDTDTAVTPHHQHNGHNGHKAHPATMPSNLFCVSPATQRKFMVMSHPDYIPHDHPLVFQNRRQWYPLSASTGLPPAASKKSSGMQDKMEPDVEDLTYDLVDAQKTDYVPHDFIVSQSAIMNRNASSPSVLETSKATAAMPFHPNRTRRHSKEAEAMDYVPMEDAPCKLSSTITLGDCGPPPCTYSTPFVGPEVVDWNQYCHNGTDSSSSLSSAPSSTSPSVGTRFESERMELDDGYIGLIQTSAQPAPFFLPLITGNSSAMSSYIQGVPPSGSISLKSEVFVGQIGGSSECPSIPRGHSRNSSAPELWNLSSTQEMMSPSLHDCLQARSRKPIAQDFPTSILDEHQDAAGYLAAPGSPSFSRRISDASIQGCAGSIMPSLLCGSSYVAMPSTGDVQNQSQGARRTRCQAPQSDSDHVSLQAAQTESSSAADEMKGVPGWCPGVTDRTINEIMSKYMNDDGNFIVWYYAAKKMHVITVSHMGIRHYAVYKKTGRIKDQAVYYIFEGGFESSSVATLIKHYMRTGLTEPASTMLVHGVNDPTKKFKTPEESSVRSSKSRLSHVKLKRPLVVRYGNPAVRK